ncbi:hypothetical protein GGS23DRAFT_301261 [Durotheca rogersii]|uniref:uncharacterized protein n=1 Tax=Durotheca rogersii TaxID=419775 RepID=UPI0022202B67|nr:uncharacterized protein GGS23DRAFT_301261 [Durotheca rogersii]KAI5867025.1 hypothetical protein GGS23DRAFT_301261 [Durotheca rogersii]
MDGFMDLLDSHRGNLACNSVQDLQDRLHGLLASKSSETRAEHASSAFEFPYNTIFHLANDAPNPPADGVVDPALQPHQPVAQEVNSFDAVHDQPNRDPVVQQAVAKHIVDAIGAVDNSSWVAGQVSNDSQGWTFKYICKDSLQAWNRANPSKDKSAIGSYSGPGGLDDPANTSRPAFDCRGTLSIAFSKAARGIVVKYNHTSLHRTVAQLIELLVPSPPPEPVSTSNGVSQRTPRAKRPPPTEGEEGSKKKRSRKKDKAGAGAPTGEAPTGDASIGGAPLGDAPAAVDQAVQNEVASENVDSSGAPNVSVLNVPPAEAERRRQTAIGLLTGRGIDPATLSVEQFNIFANQAPSLQTVSLDMLAKYGAERLRIVHPGNTRSSDSPSADGQPTDGDPAHGLGHTANSGPTETPKKKRSRKKSEATPSQILGGDGAAASLQRDSEIGTASSTLAPKSRKTRGNCKTCKERKVQCTKEHPSCKVCIDAAVQCVYLPPKPRRKSKKADEVVVDQDSDVPEAAGEGDYQAQNQGTVPVSAPAPQPTDDAAAPAHTSPDSHEDFLPDPNILTGSVESQPSATQSPATDYYHPNNTVFTYPQNPQPSSEHMATSALTFSQPQAYVTQPEASPAATFSSTSTAPEHSPGLAVAQPSSATTTQKTKSNSTSSRRSLPTGQNKHTPASSVAPANTPNWNGSPTARHAATASPTLSQTPASRWSKSRKSATESSLKTHDGIAQAAALSQAATQPQGQPSPVMGSAYQATAQTMSQQGRRSQTSTPVASAPRPSSQTPQTAAATSYDGTPSSSIPSYDPYARYNNPAHDQYSNASTDHATTRIAYEPGSYPNAATTTSASYSSVPAYDYSRSTTPANGRLRRLEALNHTPNRKPRIITLCHRLPLPPPTATWPALPTREPRIRALPTVSTRPSPTGPTQHSSKLPISKPNKTGMVSTLPITMPTEPRATIVIAGTAVTAVRQTRTTPRRTAATGPMCPDTQTKGTAPAPMISLFTISSGPAALHTKADPGFVRSSSNHARARQRLRVQ